MVKNPLAVAEAKGDMGQEDPREEEMATHCSLLT